MKKMILLVIGVGLALSACTPAQKGATVGGGIGAAAGAIIGGNSGHTAEGAVIGGALGALGGAIINDQVDQGKRKAYQQGYNQGAAQAGSVPSQGSTPQPRQPQPQYNTTPR
jgi:uncharacterized membrane protein YebE (DUF533 family)